MKTTAFLLLSSLALGSLPSFAGNPPMATTIDRSALCTTADGNTRLSIYYLDLIPQKIALMVEAKFGPSTLSYLVNNLRGVYDEAQKTTTFSFLVQDRGEVQLVVGQKSAPVNKLVITKTGETIPLSCQVD